MFPPAARRASIPSSLCDMSEDLALAASRRAHLSGRRGWSSPADAPRLLGMNVPSPIVALEDRKERNQEAHRARKVRWNRGPHHRPLAVVARKDENNAMLQ